jgi:hypothetical protein
MGCSLYNEYILPILNPTTTTDPGTPTDPPTDPPATQEYLYTKGNFVEKTVSSSGGSIKFEVWVDESGRASDWGAAEIMMLYDAKQPRAKKGRFAAILPYKIKGCVDDSCREPRYNLPWNQWRSVACEWGPNTWTCVIDGVRVPTVLDEPWSENITAVYGCLGSRCLEGAKLRNIEWGK